MRISDWSSDVCSSDLRRRAAQADAERHSRPDLRAPLLVAADARSVRRTGQERQDAAEHRTARRLKPGAYSRLCIRAGADRSEEHTSELQSLMRISYAVFCIKKKKKQIKHTHTNDTIQT